MLNRIKKRLTALIYKEHLDNELDEEFRYHLERQIELNISGGMSPEEARYAALSSFARVEQSKEQCRDARRVGFIEDLVNDVRYGIRILIKNPLFTVIAVLTLGLGIGADTTMFSAVDGLLLRPLSFPEPERLLWIGGWDRAHDDREQGVTPADFLDYRAQSRSFDQLAAAVSDSVPMNLTGAGDPERLRGALVTANYLELFGVAAQLGRTFVSQEEHDPANDAVVVLSDGLWKRLGGDPTIINRTITLDGRKLTVIGVMPAKFNYPFGVDVWTPFSFQPSSQSPFRSRELHFLRPVGRLKRGVSIAAAQSDVDAIARQLEALYPKTNTNQSLFLTSLKDHVVGNVKVTLLVLLGAVGFVLVIACANVANLLLARAATRQKEFAIRSAVGAGHGRVLRQLTTESLILSLLGGALGVLLSYWGVRLLVKLAGDNLPSTNKIQIDMRVLGFTLLVSLCVGVVFGLVPLIHSTRISLTSVLSERTRALTGNHSLRSLSFLVIAEVSLAVVLLIGTGLLIKSFVLLQRVPTGFDEKSVVTARIELPNPFVQPEKKAIFFEQLHQRITGLPGVEAVGMITELPLANQSADLPFRVDGRPNQKGDEDGSSDIRNVNTEYFHAMHIPILRGRNFTETEVHESTRVVIVSDSMATLFFKGEEPLGQRLIFNVLGPQPYEVIGVVGDVRHRGLNIQPRQTTYFPSLRLGYTNLVIRTSLDVGALAGIVRKEVKGIDPNLPVTNIKTMEQWRSESVSQPRFRTLLLGTFSAVALLLAVIGIYGVMAYAVTQRTLEVGIRMALGAQPRHVMKLILGAGIKLTISGVMVGLLAAFGLTRLLQSLLFGISATDPLTFLVIALLVIFVAFLACLVPAKRALKVDPLIAIKYE